MVLKSTFIGALCTIALLALLALSRQVKHTSEQTFELTEVETLTLEPPPAPPEITPAEEPEGSEDQPPADALAESLATTPLPSIPQQLTSIPIPEVTLTMDQLPISTAIDTFHTDSPPAALPTPIKTAPLKKAVAKKPTYAPLTKSKTPSKPLPRKPAPKSYYSAGDLDGNPRERYTGKYTWPRTAKGKTASVKLLIEINTTGHVKVISVVSSTNSALNSAAMKVATGSRFTSPVYRGKPVKARFYKNYILKK